ncbi:molybdopterin molybdotransferase MoeA [Flavobacterium sedimenticola]|uniref:Molybdopterin molybdenumtransferase n=1 Tax=Flavobacterium sedimenticola TaxID=3043286 RepID=A0ABT6XRI1_9FLAO|nr:gephyrin-like molybdotransferase Glp [Flavobacterium sedimenticola]MDI9257628.1 molybdopterin molybdotransferase MoeA [Flavobacterium sedimenticola]
MITVAEAFSILENLNFPKRIIEVSLWEARYHVLAETVVSPIDMPPFRQATMDGFALCLHNSLPYEIVSEVKAGDVCNIALQPGQAVKIFTGAAVPNSAQAVIPIEKVTVEKGTLQLQENIKPETNVRPKGAQIAQNEKALADGSLLNAAAVGFLAGLGVDRVKVYQKPSVAIVVTGNELVAPGKALPEGKVYNSNTLMLQTALWDAHFETINTYQVADDFESTKAVLLQAINENDVVLVSGGISVGDYDFVGKALEQLGVTTLFYKVNQKPGKPLYAGQLNHKIILALPGNPAASLTCFYVYVLPTLQRYCGSQGGYGSDVQKTITHDFSVDNPRAQFLKALVSNDEVTILSHQDSAMLNSFAQANALVYLPEGKYKVHQNDKVVLYTI